MDLSVEIFPSFRLKDPFMVAASHWTADLQAIKNFVDLSPSALTLKTTSARYGGSLDKIISLQRNQRRLIDWTKRVFANYTDGPKELELWDVVATYEMLDKVEKLLPETLLGVSILQGENYKDIREQLDESKYDYTELNLKYSLRGIQIDDILRYLDEIESDIEGYCDTFSSKPIFVKISREISPIIKTNRFLELLKKLSKNRIGIIVANSRKMLVPPSRNSAQEPEELSEGVVVGEYLFMETYNLIKTICSSGLEPNELPAIIASGGIVDIGSMLDAIGSGARAVQLCTVYDTRGIYVHAWLRDQLIEICKKYGSFSRLSSALKEVQKWKEIIKETRSFPINEIALVTAAFNKEKEVSQILKESIEAECISPNQDVASESKIIEFPFPILFVVTKGNISSFLYSYQIIDDYSLEPISYDSANYFCKDVIEKGQEYDLAIIPLSAIAYLQRHLNDKNVLYPIIINSVGNSNIELVGPQDDINKVDVVFHFGGNSSHFAQNELIKIRHPEFRPISWEKLVPVLKTWPMNTAILAKPPLSRFYGLLGYSTGRSSWKRIWHISEKIYLIASNRFIYEKSGKVYADEIDRKINKIRIEYLKNPNKAIRRAKWFGFVDYCSKLMGRIE